MSEKVTIQINKETYQSLSEKFESQKLQFVSINVNNVEEFINYILNNFVVNAKEFDQLGEQQKEILEKININDLDVNSLLKMITNSLDDKDSDEDEKKEINSHENFSKKN